MQRLWWVWVRNPQGLCSITRQGSLMSWFAFNWCYFYRLSPPPILLLLQLCDMSSFQSRSSKHWSSTTIYTSMAAWNWSDKHTYCTTKHAALNRNWRMVKECEENCVKCEVLLHPVWRFWHDSSSGVSYPQGAVLHVIMLLQTVALPFSSFISASSGLKLWSVPPTKIYNKGLLSFSFTLKVKAAILSATSTVITSVFKLWPHILQKEADPIFRVLCVVNPISPHHCLHPCCTLNVLWNPPETEHLQVFNLYSCIKKLFLQV